MRIRIGTRGSQLARAQSGNVGRALEELGHEIEFVIIKTEGDVQDKRPFEEIGAPGVFVRQIEQALLEERVDVAVHSYKDLPSMGPEELVVAAVPAREDPRDLLLVRVEARTAEQTLPVVPKARVGTASARRSALLTDARSDIEIELLRGNVPTRLRRLREGDFDAIVLAAAGLARLDAERKRSGEEPLDYVGIEKTALDPAIFVPAPTQGAVAVQVRADDRPVRETVARLDDPATRRCTEVERRLLARVEGGCNVAFGAWCREVNGTELRLDAVLEVNGGLVRAGESGNDPRALADGVYDRLVPGASMK